MTAGREARRISLPPHIRQTLIDYARGPIVLISALILLLIISAYSVFGAWEREQVLALSLGMTGGMLISNGFGQAIARRVSPGKRVLLVSTDPAHSTSDIFERPFARAEREVLPALCGLEVDAEFEARRYLDEVKQQIRDRLRAGRDRSEIADDRDAQCRECCVASADREPTGRFPRQVSSPLSHPTLHQTSRLKDEPFRGG